MPDGHRIAIDVGGTFTDLVALTADGRLEDAKVPSDREQPQRALATGLEALAGRLGHADVPALLRETAIVVNGTTVALNAVLQRRGARTGLLCTRGFRDTLEARLGHKEQRYNFRYAPPPALVPRYLRLPVTGRLDRDGDELEPLNRDDVAAAATVFREENVEAVAICFLWSSADSRHEELAADALVAAMPGLHVVKSSDILPLIREYDRTSSTVLAAYVGPIVRRYVKAVEDLLASSGFEGRTRYVQSNGGLAEAAEVLRRPTVLLQSGPATAPAAASYFAGVERPDLITIDMGGTSLDATLIRDGLPDMRAVGDLDGYRVATAMVDVSTIGAGGGSIASFDAGLLRVGPESAEADPGPACYGRGGMAATVTDADLVSGLLNPAGLLGATVALDGDRAGAVLAELAEAGGISVDDAAVGVREIVARNMADAVRAITVRRGHDPRDFALVAGGGAGGLHAAAVADELGVRTVIVPRLASTFCAFGAAIAPLRHDYGVSLAARWADVDLARIEDAFAELESRAHTVLVGEGAEPSAVELIRTLDLRYKDQVYECAVAVTDVELGDAHARSVVEDRFHRRHHELYEFSQPGYPCELLALGMTAVAPSPVPAVGGDAQDGDPVSSLSRRRALGIGGDETGAEVHDGARLRLGDELRGPAVVEEPYTAIVVPHGWSLRLGERDAYVLNREPEVGG